MSIPGINLKTLLERPFNQGERPEDRDAEIVRLIQTGAVDVNENIDGVAALIQFLVYSYTTSENSPVPAALVAYGADVNCVDILGVSALVNAVMLFNRVVIIAALQGKSKRQLIDMFNIVPETKDLIFKLLDLSEDERSRISGELNDIKIRR